MNAHASTENKTQQKKNDIYSGIELLLERIRNNKIKIVPGYTKMYKRETKKKRSFRPIIGIHSLHNLTNDNGTN